MRASLSRVGTAALVLFGVAGAANAAQVRGVLQVEPEPVGLDSLAPLPSASQIQVAQPARGFRTRVPDHALFLRVVDSLPLDEPGAVPEIRIRGFAFEPRVVSCPVDAPVRFVNETSREVEVLVGGRSLGPLAPAAEASWVCETGAGGAEHKTVSTREHPFMSASIYVGEVGVAAQPDPDGRFQMTAPAGTYRLLVVSDRGVVHERAVQVENRDVDLGVIRPQESAP